MTGTSQILTDLLNVFLSSSQLEHHKQGQNPVLDYTPKKGRSSLLSSHLLSNGVVGDSSETAEGVW